MLKNNYQKGSVSVSSVAIMAIVALIAVMLIIAEIKYYKTSPVVVMTPNATPLITSSPIFNETANWNVYTSKEYGFEVKYPKDWKSTENSETDFSQPRLSIASPETLIEIEKEKASSNGDYVTSIHDIAISYYPSVEEMPFNKSNNYGAKTIDELIGNKKALLTKVGELEIDGVKAVAVIQHGESQYYTVFIEKNKHLYEIFFDDKAWIWDGKNLTAIAKQILSTFKFTK